MRIWVIIGLILLVVLPAISQETTPPVDLPTETLTVAPTFTETLTETPTSTVTATNTPTLTLTAELTPETTVDSIPSVTISPTVQPPEQTATLIVETTATLASFMTLTPTETVLAETTSEVTIEPETTPEATTEPEITPETTAESTESVLMTATAPYIPLRVLVGQVLYQNRLTHGDILVVASTDGILTGNTITNEQGFFTVPVPAEVSYHLTLSADLHRTIELDLQPQAVVPELILAGGDLNGDGCINIDDLNRLLGAFEQIGSSPTDITADGITDAVDLAILTGNYQSDCIAVVRIPEATATP